MPDITQWSTYGSQMPTELEMQHWLASFPRGNIGLPLGPASGLCMIDIDTEDQALIDAIMNILPPSPWVRVGKKGMGLAYRFEGQKNFKLRGAAGGMIMEFLGLGNQMVMPPSIHPETQQPYTANANLWDVLDKVPCLGEDIEDIPMCAHWFASNYLPASRDTTRGFIRRWLILDFNKRVADKDKVTNLAEIIVAEERQAIAAWALEGLRRLNDAEDFTEPACHLFRIGQMRRINNSVQAFLEDAAGVERGDGEVKAQELYDTYVQHIQNYRRGTAVSFERFMQMCEDLDLDVTRDLLGDYVVRGVCMAAKFAA
jgi:hypothetical protein